MLVQEGYVWKNLSAFEGFSEMESASPGGFVVKDGPIGSSCWHPQALATDNPATTVSELPLYGVALPV